jgi:hypothetical protein
MPRAHTSQRRSVPGYPAIGLIRRRSAGALGLADGTGRLFAFRSGSDRRRDPDSWADRIGERSARASHQHVRGHRESRTQRQDSGLTRERTDVERGERK